METEKFHRMLQTSMAVQIDLQHRILEELILIRQAMEANEPDPDPEQDPFQTLNGPRL